MHEKTNKTIKALMACLAVCLGVNAVYAADPPPKTYQIEPQSVSKALKAFAAQADMQLIFTEKDAGGAKSSGVTGTKSAREALQEILKGTGLEFEFTANNVVVVRKTSAVLATKSSDPPGDDAKDPRKEGKSDSSEGFRVGQVGQEAAGPQVASHKKNDEPELTEIIVTGTHIRGVSPTSQVITIDRGAIERSGFSTSADLIRSLPENFSGGNSPQAVAGNAPTTNQTFSGGSSPNLRGLGAQSTLTLINGRRLGQDTPYGGVDISLIPLDAIERVEILTDGSSATYGSDAVAGVVNFILKKNYDGAQSTLSFGKATDGGAFDRRFSQLLGKSWESGGVLVTYEHEKQDALDASQRDFTSSTTTPFFLLPETSRDSVFVSGHQNLSGVISVFLDALYTSRDSTSVQSFPTVTTPRTTSLKSSVKEYFTNGGLEIDLAGGWKSTLSANVSGERAPYVQVLLPSDALQHAESLRSTSNAFEIDADGPILTLGSRTIRAAIGGGYRKETLSLDDQVADISVVDANRNVNYVFGEVNIPLLTRPELDVPVLSLTASGRYEHYSDVGGKAVPKVGLAYHIAPSVSLRASWGKSFRAPTLNDLHGLFRIYALTIPDPIPPSGESNILYLNGSNPTVEAETANTWTFGAAFDPEWNRAIHFGANYFDIKYSNRIQSFGDVGSALTDPVNAPLVTRNPSAAAQQGYISSAFSFDDFSNTGYDPSTTSAVVDGRARNLTIQHISGVDLVGNYRLTIPVGTIDLFGNGSYLRLLQQTTPLSGEVELASRAFNPPRFRARGGSTLLIGNWSTTATLNWLSSSINTYVPELSPVASWSTVDLQIAYAAPKGATLGGLRCALSIQNLLNRDPPFIRYDANVGGLNYDSNNASPLGRFITLAISKAW